MLLRPGRSTVLSADRVTSDWSCDAEIEQSARWVAGIRAARSVRDRLLAAIGSAESRSSAFSTMRMLASLPVATMPRTDSPEGEEIGRWFGSGPRRGRRLHPSLLSRAPVAVLVLPDDRSSYTRGRHRQALQTNVTRSTKAGLVCRLESDPVTCGAAIAEVASLRHQDAAAMVSGSTPGFAPRTWLATTADGRPVGLAEVYVDGEWAGLATLVTAPDNPAGGALRYLLHTTVVEALADSGVRNLVVGGSMLLTPSGTRYLQRRLGYQPHRLRFGRAPSGS